MITEDYCSYEVSNLLKEKGFEGICDYAYSNKGNYFEIDRSNFDEVYCLRPTLQMAMKWLREVHGIHIQAWCPFVDCDTDKFGIKYNVVISNLNNCCIAFDTDIEENHYNSYEEAVEASLKYCLENLI